MPHIVIEYSKNIGDIVEISKLVQEIHTELPKHGIERDRLKTRAHECNYVAVGDQGSHGHMIHAKLLFIEGRDMKVKKKFGDILHKMMKDAVGDKVRHCQITLEIRDMDSDSYYK